MHKLDPRMKLWLCLDYLTLGTKTEYETNVLELWNFYEIEIKNITGACFSHKRLFTLRL